MILSFDTIKNTIIKFKLWLEIEFLIWQYNFVPFSVSEQNKAAKLYPETSGRRAGLIKLNECYDLLGDNQNFGVNNLLSLN